MMTDFKQSIPYKLSQVLRLKRQLIDKQIKTLGLARSHWQTIAYIHILGTPCRQQDLLKASDFDRAQLARILDSLEKNNLINRMQLPNDRRSLEIKFTNQGRKIEKQVANALYSESEIMLKDFNKQEKEVFNRLLNQMEKNILTELKKHK